MYGVPESAFSAVEKAQLDQYLKCIGCAIEGLDEHPNFLYQVNGTVLCLRHAKEKYGSATTETNDKYISTPNGPSSGFYVSAD